MDRANNSPVTSEGRLDTRELLFSATDRQGRICHVNDAFCRIAGAGPDKFVGQPHSVVRHPDMPRTIYRVFWDALVAGEPTAAYMKNRAVDGSHYWVIATAVPVDNGQSMLSVQMQPSGELFTSAMSIYEELRAIELDFESRGDSAGGLKASELRLHAMLGELGYRSYEEFVHAVVPLEIRTRSAALGDGPIDDRDDEHGDQAVGRANILRHTATSIARELETQADRVSAFIELSQKLDTKSQFVIELARSVRLASLNATAAASRTERAGLALGVIASAIGENAEESSKLAETMEQTNARTVRSLRRSEFASSIARLQIEMLLDSLPAMLQEPSEEPERSALDREGLELLVRALQGSVKSLYGSFRCTEQDLRPLEARLMNLRRLVQALRTTHLAGVIESHRTGGAGNFLALFDQVGESVESARAELREFSDVLKVTRQGIADLLRDEQTMLSSLATISSPATLSTPQLVAL